jgi:hypothetical protein
LKKNVSHFSDKLYSIFPGWVQIKGRDSALIKARLSTASGTTCIGTTLARSHCWSFLKGGFVLDSASQSSLLYFKVIIISFVVSDTSPKCNWRSMHHARYYLNTPGSPSFSFFGFSIHISELKKETCGSQPDPANS